jgi:RNA recognition motif-containing protein
VCKTVSPEEFKSLFQNVGDIKQLRMFPTSKCAFVTFGRTEDAVAAESKYQGTRLGTMDLKINVGRATKSLWVGNVGHGVSEDQLKAEFEKVGPVTSVKVLSEQKNCIC